MTDDWHDAMYDAAMDALYEEHKEIAIDEFIYERLQSYYLNNPNLIQAPINSLNQSQMLLNHNATAAFIFAAIAIEVGLKFGFIKPMVLWTCS